MKNLKDNFLNHPLYKKLHRLFTFEGDLFFAPASLAYYLLFSIMPTLLIIAMVISLFAEYDKLKIFLSYYLNEEQVSSFISFINMNRLGSFISLGFSAIVAFYIASKGIDNFFSYTRFKNGLSRPPFIKSKIKSISATIALIFILAILFVLLATITYYSILLDLFFTFALFRFLFLGLVLTLIISFLYRLSSSFIFKWKDVFIGAIIASFSLSLGIIGYDLYLRYVASYDTLYGPISNLIILLFLFYVISYCILFGYHVVVLLHSKKND